MPPPLLWGGLGAVLGILATNVVNSFLAEAEGDAQTSGRSVADASTASMARPSAAALRPFNFHYHLGPNATTEYIDGVQYKVIPGMQCREEILFIYKEVPYRPETGGEKALQLEMARQCNGDVRCNAVHCRGQNCAFNFPTCEPVGSSNAKSVLYLRPDRAQRAIPHQHTWREEIAALKVSELPDFSMFLSEPARSQAIAARRIEDPDQREEALAPLYDAMFREPMTLAKHNVSDYMKGGTRYQEWRAPAAPDAPAQKLFADPPVHGPRAKEFVKVTGHDMAAFHPYVWLEPNHKLVFFAIPKVASTEYLKLYDRLLGYDVDFEGALWPYAPHFLFSYVNTRPRFVFYRMTPSEATRVLNHPSYRKVMFMRDPKERLLSAYLDKLTIPHDIPKYFGKNVTSLTFDEFVRKMCEPYFLDQPTSNGPRADPHFRLQFLTANVYKFLPLMDFIGWSKGAHGKAFLETYGLWEQYGASFGAVPGVEHKGFMQRDTTGKNAAKHTTGSTSKFDKYYTPELSAMVDEAYAFDYAVLEEVGLVKGGPPVDGRHAPYRTARCVIKDCWPGPPREVWNADDPTQHVDTIREAQGTVAVGGARFELYYGNTCHSERLRGTDNLVLSGTRAHWEELRRQYAAQCGAREDCAAVVCGSHHCQMRDKCTRSVSNGVHDWVWLKKI